MDRIINSIFIFFKIVFWIILITLILPFILIYIAFKLIISRILKLKKKKLQSHIIEGELIWKKS